jgi:hypothetical protein
MRCDRAALAHEILGTKNPVERRRGGEVLSLVEQCRDDCARGAVAERLRGADRQQRRSSLCGERVRLNALRMIRNGDSAGDPVIKNEPRPGFSNLRPSGVLLPTLDIRSINHR